MFINHQLKMIQIGSTLVSRDIIEKWFVCRLGKCKGMCCVYGDAGAPLEDKEIDILRDIYPKVQPFMTPDGIASVEKNGVYVTDFDDEKVTPLINDNEECAFVYRENDRVCCAIEKAFLEGLTKFRKPVSCHLYPIRVTKYADFEAVNYHEWELCRDGLRLGRRLGVPMYIYLKEPLIRKFGKEWFEELCRVVFGIGTSR